MCVITEKTSCFCLSQKEMILEQGFSSSAFIPNVNVCLSQEVDDMTLTTNRCDFCPATATKRTDFVQRLP